MKTVIRGDAPGALSVKPESKHEEILQNIRVLLSTAKYDVPLAREMGLDAEYLHRPQPAAETLLYQTIADAIQQEEIQEGDTVDVRYLYGSEALADQEGLPVSVRMVSVHLAD